eukprot:Opistho-2@64272
MATHNGHQLPNSHVSFLGYVRNEETAFKVFAEARKGGCRLVTYRLRDVLFGPGEGYVYDSSSSEIQRWTDPYDWGETHHTDSRYLLFYRQANVVVDPLTGAKRKVERETGLRKKIMADPHSNLRLINYYTDSYVASNGNDDIYFVPPSQAAQRHGNPKEMLATRLLKRHKDSSMASPSPSPSPSISPMTPVSVLNGGPLDDGHHQPLVLQNADLQRLQRTIAMTYARNPSAENWTPQAMAQRMGPLETATVPRRMQGAKRMRSQSESDLSKTFAPPIKTENTFSWQDLDAQGLIDWHQAAQLLAQAPVLNATRSHKLMAPTRGKSFYVDDNPMHPPAQPSLGHVMGGPVGPSMQMHAQQQHQQHQQQLQHQQQFQQQQQQQQQLHQLQQQMNMQMQQHHVQPSAVDYSGWDPLAELHADTQRTHVP